MIELSGSAKEKISNIISRETIYSPSDIKEALRILLWDMSKLMFAVDFAMTFNIDLIQASVKTNGMFYELKIK